MKIEKVVVTNEDAIGMVEQRILVDTLTSQLNHAIDQGFVSREQIALLENNASFVLAYQHKFANRDHSDILKPNASLDDPTRLPESMAKNKILLKSIIATYDP